MDSIDGRNYNNVKFGTKAKPTAAAVSKATGGKAAAPAPAPAGATQEGVDANGNVVGHVVNGVWVPLAKQ
jgi:hypothetical protein